MALGTDQFRDLSCSATYYGDGSGMANHVYTSVETLGKKPPKTGTWYLFADAGGTCEKKTTTVSADSNGNGKLMVSVK